MKHTIKSFDDRFTLFYRNPNYEGVFLNGDLKQTINSNLIEKEGSKIYITAEFFLKDEERMYRRMAYTGWEFLENYGGFRNALGLILSPLVAGIALRSFKYDLTTKHMKEKKRKATG